MIKIENYIESIKTKFLQIDNLQPWEIIDGLENYILQIIQKLDNDFVIENNIAIHKSAIIE